MATRYIVRDIATKGCDFLIWGDDDETAARNTLAQALAEGCEVELISMPSDQMDNHTKHLIGLSGQTFVRCGHVLPIPVLDGLLSPKAFETD